MRHGHGRSRRIVRLRARFSRGASALALASAFTILSPGFEVRENASDGEALGLVWGGTSAHAKKRRGRGGFRGEETNTYGSFSSPAPAPASSSPASPAASSSSASGSPGSNAGTGNNNARSDNNGNRPSGRRNNDDDDNGSGGIPGQAPTVVEGLKRLFETPPAPKPAVANPASPGNVTSAKSSLGAPAHTSTNLSAAKTPKPSPKGPRGLPVDTASGAAAANHPHASNELLGVRLNTKSVEKLKGLGFSVPLQPKTAFDVLLVNTPPGVDAAEAQAMLREALPKDKFETNKVYRNYEPRSSAGNAHSVTSASPRLTCTGSRCVPRDLIKWSPETLAGCSAGVAVGVLDTGLDVNHPAFVRPITNSFVPEGRLPAPTWHGTAVYALLAGNPRSGTPGLIPNATIYHGNVFYSDASGEFATDTHVLLSALDWMDRAGVKVVNMSFAGPRDQLMEEAIAKLSAKGMIFVAAVGNEGPTAEPAYPAAYRQVIAVTAIKADRRVYPFANRGRHIDLAAPGVDIWTAVPGGREGFYTGTSFAAPFATALVATLYRDNPTPLKEKMLARLEYDDLGLPGRDSTYGRGLALAPRTCAPTPSVAETPAPPPTWGTTSIDKASTRPATPAAISAGIR